jgi:phosphoribosylanthranilate isomerase
VFRIKICGIKTIAEAEAAVAAGADAVGLNFYQKSPRFVSTQVAADIAQALPEGVPEGVTVVGVFVNLTAERMNEIASSVGLDAIQLHGDEPPTLLGELNSKYRIVRARRWSERGLPDIAEDLQACLENGRHVDALLLDAAAAGQFGGTGSQLPWAKVRDYSNSLGETQLILAGGLTPENVAEAIRTVRPYGVDVASGVESSPGVKDHGKVRAFVEAAKTAFSEVG